VSTTCIPILTQELFSSTTQMELPLISRTSSHLICSPSHRKGTRRSWKTGMCLLTGGNQGLSPNTRPMGLQYSMPIWTPVLWLPAYRATAAFGIHGMAIREKPLLLWLCSTVVELQRTSVGTAVPKLRPGDSIRSVAPIVIKLALGHGSRRFVKSER
jgi:hypothetical protein